MISVLMSVYNKSKLSEVKECLDSVFCQSLKSDNIVIVIDGDIPDDLANFLTEVEKKRSEVVVCKLAKNEGLGIALNYGLGLTTNELVARVDTDDICTPERFSKQVACFNNDHELTVVGSTVLEFCKDIDTIVAIRQLPKEHDGIIKYMKKRCPFNHPSVVFKKSAVINAGGYMDFFYLEDYYLYVRLFLAGAKFYNLEEGLVYMRVNSDTYRRRGGYKYFKSLKKFYHYMRENKIINFFEYMYIISVRFCVQVLMPKSLRGLFYKKLLRKKAGQE